MSKYGLSAKQIGIRLQEHRGKRMFHNGATLEALCKKAKMTETNWKEREKGKMDMRLSTFFKMLSALKVTPSQFFEGMKK